MEHGPEDVAQDTELDAAAVADDQWIVDDVELYALVDRLSSSPTALSATIRPSQHLPMLPFSYEGVLPFL